MKKILIIEDNEQDQKIMGKILSRSGFSDISFADSGQSGVLLALEIKPEIILVDTVLPGIDGFETCMQLKKVNNVTANVIMMTGRIDAVDADRAKMMGADDYCVKTSDYKAIVNAVKKVAGIPVEEGDLPPQVKQTVLAPEDERKIAPDLAWGIKKTNEGIKTLYRELEIKTDELKELDKLKSEFVATVSHELKTPLTLITGAISQMLTGVYGEISNLQREKLTIALNGSKLLRRIIDDLLDISRLEAREIKLNKEMICLNDIAQEVCASFSNMAQEKKLTLKLLSKKPSIQVVGDKDRITQVITNLIGNSFKFTTQGGIEVICEDNANEGICHVKDTGEGIDEKDLPDVFERFRQFGKKFGPGQEGTGLGLSICQSIMELHNGRISVKSKKGSGTTFTFALPKRE